MVFQRRNDCHEPRGRIVTQIRVVPDDTGTVARWGFQRSGAVPMQYNAALGVLEGEELKGGILFTGYNGSEVEVHYFGPGTLKRHVLKTIMTVALQYFRVNRLVVRTRKESMSRGVKKLGAVFEGMQRRVYGPSDGREHAAEVWVFFKERMAQIAGLEA
jgi:hypothetical protein